MAANDGHDGHGDHHQAFFHHNDSSETLYERNNHDMPERAMPRSPPFWPATAPAVTLGLTSMPPMPTMIPVLTTMTPVTVPNLPGSSVNIVSGLENARIDIHPLDHLASYPSVKRLSHVLQKNIPLAPLIIQTSRSVASTRKRLPRSFGAPSFTSSASQPTLDCQPPSTTVLRLLHHLDATAAHALRSFDRFILVILHAGSITRHFIISSASQLRELGSYLKRTYQREASKWIGASDITVYVGAVSFTVTVAAFDALVFVGEWWFDGRVEREMEKREGMEGEA